MSRTRRNAKDAGTRWNTACAQYLRDNGLPRVERRTQGGARDKGDLAGIHKVAVECKDTATHTLASFVAEANKEAENAGEPIGVAWFKRRGKSSPGDGYVLLDGAAFARLALLLEQLR